MIRQIISTLLGDANERTLKKLWPLVQKINEIEQKYQDEKLSEEGIKIKTQAFKDRIVAGESLDGLLPEAFALVKYAARTIFGRTYEVRGREMKWEMIPFDVQLIGGMVLHSGKISR